MSDYRSLAPLGESSTSKSSSGKYSSSTGLTSDFSGEGDEDRTPSSPPRRRRVPGTVSQKACVSCKRARQKVRSLRPRAMFHCRRFVWCCLCTFFIDYTDRLSFCQFNSVTALSPTLAASVCNGTFSANGNHTRRSQRMTSSTRSSPYKIVTSR